MAKKETFFQKLTRIFEYKKSVVKIFRIINVSLVIGVAFLNIKSCAQAEQIEDQQKQIQNLIKENEKLKIDFSKITYELEMTKNELSARQRASDDSPIPQWTKRVVGKNFYFKRINKAFYEEWLVPQDISKEEFINKPDTVGLPKATVKEIRDMDSVVFARRRPYTRKVKIFDKWWYITKYPIFYDGYPIYVEGWAMPEQL